VDARIPAPQPPIGSARATVLGMPMDMEQQILALLRGM